MSFESGFKKRKNRRLSEIGCQIVPNRRCKKVEGVLSEKFSFMLWDFEEIFTR